METNRNWVRSAYGELPSPGAERAAPPMAPPAAAPDEGCIDMALVMAYIKRQRWGELYEPEAGLSRGTVFAELDLPFVGEGACPR